MYTFASLSQGKPVPSRWIAACDFSASSSSPAVYGTSSFSILAIAGTVSSRVLSLGPVLLVFSPFVVSSLGTLKPPGLSLFVAVLSRRPARKKEAISAAPAAIMSRLNTQEMAFLALELWTLYFFMPPEILTPKSPPAASAPAPRRSGRYRSRGRRGCRRGGGRPLVHAPLWPPLAPRHRCTAP